MKVIDLLNKIANDKEVPKEIKYNACLFAFDRQSQDYYCEEYGSLFEYLINEHRTGEFLNKEVEIIEEDKKIEQLKWNEKSSYNQEGDTKKVQKILLSRSEQLKSSINEIIDYLEEKE